MLILAIDTTGPLGSAALWDGENLSQRFNESEYSHLEELAPMIKNMLVALAIAPEDIDAIAVSQGPGSFTGIRIGMATAKGFAQVWNKPVIEVPTLASFAFGEYAEIFGQFPELASENAFMICPMFDARRSQVYAGAYLPFNKEAVVSDGAYDADEFLGSVKAAAAGRTVIFYGDGIKVYEKNIEAAFADGSADPAPGSASEKTSAPEYILAPESCRYQTAAACARLAEVLYKEGKLTDCYSCRPEYLRLAEAERKLKEKTAASVNASNGQDHGLSSVSTLNDQGAGK